MTTTNTVPAPRFARTAPDGASEVLTLVRLTAGPLAGATFLCEALESAEYPYLVQITTGANLGDDFVGLYDLDGELVDAGNSEWEIVEEAPTEVIEQIEIEWATGSNVVTRIEA